MTLSSKPKRSLVRDIAGVFSGNLAAMVAILLTNVVLSRGLGPAGYGIFTSLLAVLMVSTSLVQLGISKSAVYHIGQQVFSRRMVVNGVLTLWILTSVSGIIISLISVAVIRNPNFSLPMVIAAVFLIPFFLGNIYLSGVFLGLDEIRRSNFLYYTPAVFTLVFSALMVFVFKLGVVGAIVAALLGGLLTFLVAVVQLHRRFGIGVPAPRNVLFSLGKLGFVYALSHTLLKLNYKADVLLLQKMCPAAEVGFYSLGVSVTEQLWMIPFAMGLVLMSRTANDRDQELAGRRTALLLKTGLTMGVLGALFLWLLAPLLVPLIFGAPYLASVPVVRAILPGIVIFIVFRLLESHLAGMGKPHLALWALVPSLALNMGLNLWLIPRYGALGAAWATNISYAIAATVYVAIYTKTLRISLFDLFVPTRHDLEKVKQLLAKRKSRVK